MKKVAILALGALALGACSESPTTPGSAAVPQFSEGNALFTLATPATPVASSQSGQDAITVTWSPTLEVLQAECDDLAAANTENSADTCRGVHFELYRNGVYLVDVAGDRYVDGGLAPGAYSYQLKAKGLEQTPREASFTYHSLMSESSNVVVIALLACGPPTVTAAITAGSSTYVKDAAALVSFGGETTNWSGCPGAAAQYRIVAHVTNKNDSVNEDFTTEWHDLMPAFTGGVYAIQLQLPTQNKNLRFDFEVRVSHELAAGWFMPAGMPPSVTITEPPKK